MASDKELVDGLNNALNREITTALRYIVQAATIRGSEWNSVRETYLAEVGDEIGHAQYLANKIAMLGTKPRINPDLSPPPDEVRQMLTHDIEQEKIDEAGYLKLAAMAEKLGHADLKVRLEEQAADEANHGEVMRRLLG